MSYHLTPSERAIMDILWHEKSPMPQSAIIDKAKESGTMAWKEPENGVATQPQDSDAPVVE